MAMSDAAPYKGKSPFTMLSVEECVATVAKQVLGPLGVEEVALADALGRHLAEDVASAAPIPAFPASIMDGFAVRCSDGLGTFPVDADQFAGTDDMGPLQPGHIRYVTTGSAVPLGADAVVKVEDTLQRVKSSGEVEIDVLVSSKAGANIRQVGSDTAKDEVLLRRGCQLRASELGVLAALNRTSVSVFLLPRVALLSTGNELVELGQTPDESRGQIVDSNRPLLCAMVKELGAMVTDLGVAKDEFECVRATIADAFKFADVVITSGGVSRGNKDYIKEVLEELGEIHFGEMCMKPGKPSTFATVTSAQKQRRLFFGLPGNPVSCFVTFKLLAAPAILKLAGMGSLRSPVYPRVDAVLAQPVQMDPVRPEYHRARARWDSGRIVAESTGFQRSSRIASIAETNCLLEIPKASGTLAKGTVVKALLLGGLRPEAEGFPSPAETEPLVKRRKRRVGLLLLDTAESSKVTALLRASLDAELREERRAKEAEAVKEVVESWCQEKDGLDLVLVLGELGIGNKDAEVVDTLRNLVVAAENVADLILHEGLTATPLAMLSSTVAGYRHSTLLATLPDASPAVGLLCKLITSLP